MSDMGMSATSIRRGRGVRGSTIIGFALTFPVLMGAIALGLFANHAYEVKSDLQRTAEEAARYASTRCDSRGKYAVGTGCASGATYPTVADVVAFTTSKFKAHWPVATFVSDCAASSSAGTPAVFCEALDPSTPATLAPNQRLTVTLQYHFSSPMQPLLRIIPGASNLIDLKAAGDAVVE